MKRRAILPLLLSLYFAQGLPFGFFVQVLPVVLRERGLSLVDVGLSSIVALPWALKFLWAPWVDGGRRKRWIVGLQLATSAVLLAMAGMGLGSVEVLLVSSLVLNLLSATQDIATDGLAVEALPPALRGWANGLQVAGYRVGMLVGGGAVLVLWARLGARGAFAVLAGLMLLTTAPVALWSESPRAPTTVARPSLRAFLEKPCGGIWLVLIMAYKVGDAGAVAMLRPFAVDRGLTLEAIGWLVGTVGFGAGLVGALVGGALTGHLGRRRALISFGVLQGASLLAYALVARGSLDLGWFGLCVALEHLVGGMATAALFTAMMDRCDVARAGTDYTIQASAVVLATGAASSLAGWSAEALGYSGHFVLCALAGVAATWALSVAPALRSTGTRLAGEGVALS